MHIYKLHARQSRGRKHSTRNSVGNIVIFQIEEYARTQLADLLHRFRPGRGKELVADFEHTYQVGNLFCEFQSNRKGIEIEGDNQAAAWMSVKSHGSGRARRVLVLAFF